MPLFLHGFGEHSLILVEQSFPLQPFWHIQEKSLIKSVQTPPFLHGAEAQSLMFASQKVPLHPARQLQVNPLTPLTHVAPFLHYILLRQ